MFKWEKRATEHYVQRSKKQILMRAREATENGEVGQWKISGNSGGWRRGGLFPPAGGSPLLGATPLL